jgi:hypothetical protein
MVTLLLTVLLSTGELSDEKNRELEKSIWRFSNTNFISGGSLNISMLYFSIFNVHSAVTICIDNVTE